MHPSRAPAIPEFASSLVVAGRRPAADFPVRIRTGFPTYHHRAIRKTEGVTTSARDVLAEHLTTLWRASDLSQAKTAKLVLDRLREEARQKRTSPPKEITDKRISSWLAGDHLPATKGEFDALVRVLIEAVRDRIVRRHDVGPLPEGLLDEGAWGRWFTEARRTRRPPSRRSPAKPGHTACSVDPDVLPARRAVPFAARAVVRSLFVERPALGARVVEAVETALRDRGRPVVVTGAGGFGKTMLAAWVCQTMRDRFPDGVLWVELGRRPDDRRIVDILTDQITLLTGTRQEYHTVDGVADAFAAALGDRRVLLVVDDVWRGEDVEPFLRGGDRCVRLVTTRRPPSVGGNEVPVDLMTPDQAVALLRGALPNASTAELRPLLRRCGNWPLALSLVAGVLRSLSARKSVTEAVGHLLGEFDRAGVVVLDEFADTAGNVGIAVTLAVSLKELVATSPHKEESLTRYAQLAAFPEDVPIPYHLMERIWQLNAVQTQIESERFLNHSLVVRADDGVRLHAVIHDQVRRMFPEQVALVSRALLDDCRPAAGWHTLPAGHELWAQLAHHLVQAEPDELRALLRDVRYLTTRLHHGGPLALEADLEVYLADHPKDDCATALLLFVRQEAHLLAGHTCAGDLALSLHYALLRRPDLGDELTHAEDALPNRGLVARYAPLRRAEAGLVRVFPDPPTPGCRVGWLPESDLLWSIDASGELRIRNADTGAEQASVKVVDGRLLRARLSPDGTHLAVVHERESTLERARAWEMDIQIVGPEDDAPAWQTLITIVSTATGTVVAARLRDWSSCPQFDKGPDIAWSPDSRTLAYPQKTVVRLWSPFDAAEPVTLNAASNRREKVLALAWHPVAGLACLTDSFEDRQLVLWTDPQRGGAGQAYAIEGMWLPYECAAWSPDGELLAAGGAAGALLIEPGRGGAVRTIGLGTWIQSLSWRPDGQALASATYGGVNIWTENDRHDPAGVKSASFMVTAGPARCFDAAWSPSGRYLAVAGSGPAVGIYSPTPAWSTPTSGPGALQAVCWQPTGRLLAVTEDGIVKVLDSANPDTVLWHSDRGVDDVPQWSPDGQLLAWYTTGDDPIQIRAARTGAPVRELPYTSHHDEYKVFAWPTSRQLVAHMPYYGSIVLLDSENGQETGWVARGGELQWVAVNHDATSIAICHRDGDLELVEMGSKTRTPLDQGTPYHQAVFLPGDTQLVTSTYDEIKLWDLTTQSVVARRPCSGYLRRIAVDPTGRHIAAIIQPGRVALFDAHDLNPVCQVAIDGTVSECDFDTTGRTLAVAGSTGLSLLHVLPGLVGLDV